MSCEPFVLVRPAGRFLAFKTPLSSEYDRELKEEHRFHVSMLISYVEAAQQRMGLVVDLTVTTTRESYSNMASDITR